MLLPHRVRVVIEVDGRHHYAAEAGAADTAKYAAMVKADRILRLRGYELYRFGARELPDAETAERVVAEFFDRLSQRHPNILP